jgi:pimeloyl-ACP methyl ester carboxylesterase
MKKECARMVGEFYRAAMLTSILSWLLVSVVAGQEQASAATAMTKEGITTNERAQPCQILYLGFVGALEPPGNESSGVVQLRDFLKRPQFSDVCAKVYSPYAWTGGRDWLLTHFPTHAGPLTEAELEEAPKVVLVGHSMGGWAMLGVARELRSREIPVELTVQVDSVGITDFTIPRNVKAGAIFHAHDLLMFLTTKNVRLEDPTKTRLVANVLVSHAGHESITRDPRIRDLVLHTIEDLQAARMAKSTVREGHREKPTSDHRD